MKTQARLSPDGNYISFLAPKDGVLNVWLAPYGKLEPAKPITDDTKRGIREHVWARMRSHVLFLQDEGGDENWRLYSVDVDSGKQLDLTPLKGVQAQIVGVSHKKPGVVLVGAQRSRARVARSLRDRCRDRRSARSSRRTSSEFAGYRRGSRSASRASRSRRCRKAAARSSAAPRRAGRSCLSYGQEDSLTTQPHRHRRRRHHGADGERRRAATRPRSCALDLATRQAGRHRRKRAGRCRDGLDRAAHARRRRPMAVEYLQHRAHAAHAAGGKGHRDACKAALGPQFDVASRTLDDRKWIVVVDDPVHVTSSHLYDRDTGKVTKLFDQRPELANAPLQPM